MRPASLRIVTYHRVLDTVRAAAVNASLVSATPADFAAQMRHLARHYRVVSAEEVASAQQGGRRLPARAVLVTFDDAYRDVGDIAWPILRRLALPATVFVPTAYVGGTRTFWWDRLHEALRTTRSRTLDGGTPGPLPLGTPDERRVALRTLQARVKSMPHHEAMRLVDEVCDRLGLPMSAPSDVLGWDELRQLAQQGMTIGAHTRTHPALSRLPLHEARTEIQGSRDDVLAALGAEPIIFAYPFGDHDDAVVSAVREAGFPLAVTCRDGHSRVPGAEPLRLSRTNVTPRTSNAVFWLRLSAVGPLVDRLRHRPPAVGVPAASAVASPAPAVSSRSDVGSLSPATQRRVRIGYIVSRFPKLTETFVLYELIALEAMGVAVELFPLLRERQPVAHPEAEAWVRRAHFHPVVSSAILRAQLHFVRRDPGRYVGLLLELVRRTWRSTNFLAGALVFFPKAVRFAYEMERDGVTHVHAHFCNHPALVAFVIHRLTGIPYSFTAHGSDLHVDRRMLEAKVADAAFAVTISRFNKRVMVEACGQAADERIHVVHCGVDVDQFAAKAEATAAGPLRLVCVASFEEVKGHRHLIDACATLRARGIDYVCDLVGEGPLRRTMEARIASLGLGDRVRVLGGRARPEVIRLLRMADVAVLASQPTKQGKREGIPVVLMEAMATGLPVVSTRLSGIPELVEDGCTGLLVPPADALALAEALERLARDAHLRRCMGAAGRRKVEREFDLRVNTAVLLDLFVAKDESRRPLQRVASGMGTPA